MGESEPQPTRPSGGAGSAQVLSGAVACEPACLIAYRAEQAVTHLSHDSACPTSFIRMPPRAEVNARASFEPAGFISNVGIGPQISAQERNPSQSRRVRNRSRAIEQPLNLVTS